MTKNTAFVLTNRSRWLGKALQRMLTCKKLRNFHQISLPCTFSLCFFY